jgi:hypothetical protein
MKFTVASAVLASLYLSPSQYSTAVSGFSVSSSKVKHYSLAAFVPGVKPIRGGSFSSSLHMSDVATQDATVAKGETYEYVYVQLGLYFFFSYILISMLMVSFFLDFKLM